MIKFIDSLCPFAQLSAHQQTILSQLTDPLVRTLFVITSSPALINCLSGLSAQNNPSLSIHQKPLLDDHAIVTLDQHPQALYDYINGSHSTRLGLLYEKLMQFYLQNLLGFTLIRSNSRIHQGATTLGEFDCIYENHDQQLVHIEFAAKFYLGFKLDGANTVWWPGPNCVDHLHKKVLRLLEHQLMLSHQAGAKAHLKQLGIKPIDKIELQLGGALFQSATENAPIPDYINQDCEISEWISQQHAQDLCQPLTEGMIDHPYHYYIAPQPQWLCPPILKPNQLLNIDDLSGAVETAIVKNPRPQMIFVYHQGNTTLPIKRFFMAPNNWPSCPLRSL